MKVFVYGSLKRGFHNHGLLQACKAKFVRDDFLYGTLLDLGSYPGLVQGKQKIQGEVFEVGEDAILRLDRLEDHPHFYMRKEGTTINSKESVVYYELQQTPYDKRVVKSGMWRKKR